MRFKSIVVLVLTLIVPAVVQSQTGIRPGGASGADRPGNIRGTVVMPDGSTLLMSVKVTLKVLRGEMTFTFTDQQGRFEINNLSSGQYTLEVDADGERRFELVTEKVLVPRGGATTFVTIPLKEKRRAERSPTDKTVSIAMLDQKVPGAAKRAFEHASRMETEGNTLESIEDLKKAIAIYPDYLMAHNDLGAQLLGLERFEEAAIELRTAIRIDPKAYNPQLNLGIVLLKQKSFSEALASLDKALSIEPAAPAAHLYAGIVSLKLNDPDRGVKELTAAHDLGGINYGVALLQLGQFYMRKGDRALALKSFESYLHESPNAPDAAQIQKLIDTLH
ncbi:MAG: repeat-containing protein [Acidobacteria bacterium]|nr:repeat-containing protein [Acidobacteriota bacterium]